MASQIATINQNLTTAEQMKQQTQLVMQPYANWEQYLTPAPLSIAILGELVYISSKTDFSINKNPPKTGYKYIRYPESFRACLMQVCNSGWRAFNGAHKNMDEIRLHTLKVPDYMKDAVKILFQGNDEVVHAHLPDQLENIRVVADECLTLATVTEKGFTDVIDIIQELLEACVNAQHFYGEELETVKKRIEENNMRKASSEEALKRSEKAVKSLEKQMNDANESFKSAMDSLPSGWDMIGMDFVGAITECATGMLSGLTSLMASPVSSITNVTKDLVGTFSSLSGQDTPTDGVSEINIYSRSAEILACAETIQQFVQEGVIQWNELYDQKHKRPKSDFILTQLKRVTGSLDKMPDSNPKKLAKKICEEGIDICTQLAEYAPTGKCEEAKTKELIQKITKLTESARVFDSKSKEATNSPAMVPKSPMMYNEQNKSGKQTPSQKATENARFRIEQSRAQLDKTREIYEKSMENMEKNHKELTEILITLRGCELKEIDFKTTVSMLVKGMDAMGRVKEQWEKMVRFFQMVSNIVKTSLTVSLKNFVSASEKTQSLSYNGKLFSKDLLYNQAFQATNIVNLVHMISGTYTQVSEKHLIDRISTLGKLMAMDKEKPEFQQEHEQLQNSCESAQKAILQLVLKNKADFEKNTNSRLEKIDKELLAVLPPASPEKIKSIEASVKTGFTDDMSNYV